MGAINLTPRFEAAPLFLSGAVSRRGFLTSANRQAPCREHAAWRLLGFRGHRKSWKMHFLPKERSIRCLRECVLTGRQKAFKKINSDGWQRQEKLKVLLRHQQHRKSLRAMTYQE
jgi:hypothetical protein